MDWESDDIIEAFKKFRQKCHLKVFPKGTTDEEKVSHILLGGGAEKVWIYIIHGISASKMVAGQRKY